MSLQRLGPTFPQRFKDVICPLGYEEMLAVSADATYSYPDAYYGAA